MSLSLRRLPVLITLNVTCVIAACSAETRHPATCVSTPRPAPPRAAGTESCGSRQRGSVVPHERVFIHSHHEYLCPYCLLPLLVALLLIPYASCRNEVSSLASDIVIKWGLTPFASSTQASGPMEERTRGTLELQINYTVFTHSTGILGRKTKTIFIPAPYYLTRQKKKDFYCQ